MKSYPMKRFIIYELLIEWFPSVNSFWGMSVVVSIEITCEEKRVEQGFALLDIAMTLLDSVMVESLDEMRMKLRDCFHVFNEEIVA